MCVCARLMFHSIHTYYIVLHIINFLFCYCIVVIKGLFSFYIYPKRKFVEFIQYWNCEKMNWNNCSLRWWNFHLFICVSLDILTPTQYYGWYFGKLPFVSVLALFALFLAIMHSIVFAWYEYVTYHVMLFLNWNLKKATHHQRHKQSTKRQLLYDPNFHHLKSLWP